MALLLNQRVTWRLALPVVIDTTLILSSVLASAFLLLGPEFREQASEPSFFLKLSLVAIILPLGLYLADVYDAEAKADSRQIIVRLLQSLGVTTLAFTAIYAAVPALVVARGAFALTVGFILGLVPLWRAVFDEVIDRLTPGERLLFLGTRPAAVALARDLAARQRDLSVEVVGFVEAESSAVRTFVRDPGIIGTVRDLPALVDRLHVDRVVVSLGDARGRLPMQDLLDLKLQGVRFDHLASVYEEFTGRIAVENLRPSWLVFSDGFRKPRAVTAAKRLVDMASSAVGLLAGLPIIAAVAAAIKLTSTGPVLYHQTRVGSGGRTFTLHKFRTMRTDAEESTGPVFAADEDPRVTPIGGFLRRTRLDELPQLWNILVGDMSLVGPRPERPEFVTNLTELIPFYGLRHVVKPGLTGWAQVRYAYAATVEDTMEKLQYDLFYIKNMSVLLDLLIIFSTIKTVVRRRGSR
ncbi:MAG: TIGR03013 family XrtA/PEP-CTERM system glycosyltransferase [Acidobacteriota bacterium]